MTGKPDTGHRPRMAPRKDAPPGQEQDSHGAVIPLDQRTQDDQDRARGKKPEA